MKKFFLEISLAAELDIKNAYHWYERERKGLGKKFKAEIIQSFIKIKNSPFLYQIRYTTIRICFLNGFPFGIHYTVWNSKIIIVSVFHTAQDSDRWSSI
ncbi:MAG: type II toxin-antitoxin system RelE/ParE family toxin [Bacteroidota bacterium]